LSSLPDNLEEVIDVVSDWAVKTVQEIVKALAPDGRPFMMEFPTIEKEIEDYLQLKAGGKEAYKLSLREMEEMIATKLQESAVSPDMILAVHPYDIAVSIHIDRSARLETEMAKRAFDE